MTDWFRSLSVGGIAFVSVVTLTIGLATLIVPRAAGSAQVPGATPDALESGAAPDPGPITAIGGTLAVTGDRQGAFHLDRESGDDRYTLVGDDGRIFFEGQPARVAQISWDGLEFFLDPDDCALTPGERHDPTGVAGLHLRCEGIADVREGGTVTLEGRLGVAADLLGLRGGLPDSGGTAQVGDRTLTFRDAHLTLPGGFGGSGIYIGQLWDPDANAGLTFVYDVQTHLLSLGEVHYGGGRVVVTPGACTVSERDIGLLNPHTRMVELQLRCDAVDIPTLGVVPIDAAIVAEVVEPPG